MYYHATGADIEKPDCIPCEKKPPERLYHYTSINGVRGILDARSLWASQIHFLNDTQEFKYSLGILKKVISEFLDGLPKRVAPAGGIPTPPSKPEEWLSLFYHLIEEIYFDFKVFSKTPVCVFSFSERGDLLSQWRGYCPPGGGYSIGFRSELLVPWLEAKKLFLEPCICDEREQENIIRDEITKKGENLIKRLTDEPKDPQKIMQELSVDFFMEFSRIASKLKHPAFHEECEWRIISEPIDNQQMSFRLRKSIFLPYLAIDFTDIESFPIDEIIIGPAPEQYLARFSLLQFLLRKGLKISIKESSTPYRELM